MSAAYRLVPGDRSGWWVHRGDEALDWAETQADAEALIRRYVNADLVAELVAELRILVDYLPTGKTGAAVNLVNRIEYLLKDGVR